MKYLLFFSISFLLISCSTNHSLLHNSIEIDELSTVFEFERDVKIASFNKSAIGDSVKISIEDKSMYAFKTENQSFVDKVLSPIVLPKKDLLITLSHRQIVNELTILIYKTYTSYIGRSFYRWGGDLFDLDDPQYESIRFKNRYGLDCSGFTTSGYELAVYMNLISPEDLLFSSQGYKLYCQKSGFEDGGSIFGGSNNYRLDTRELNQLGDEIVRLKKGSKLSLEQLSLLKAGDIVGRNGHYGILVESEGVLYYLESGGWVVPETDYRPVEAKPAIDKFAETGYISIRRCLKD